MLKALYSKYTLVFKRPAGTSRGTYTDRECWFIRVWDTEKPHITGLGECAPLPGLSADLGKGFISRLEEACSNIHHFDPDNPGIMKNYPSIRFGLETAIKDLENDGTRSFVDNDFTGGLAGIPVNGLIWMGDPHFMRKQIEDKLEAGFNCIKMKIGALDFDNELSLIREVREQYPVDKIEIRVDANGAFKPGEALEKLSRLSELQIHSIEQPVMAGQQKEMARLCDLSPVPIVLDEELIGANNIEEKQKILDDIRPHYLVLKPSLHGGMTGCDEWIELAEARNIGWWATSALESNIGLNAIAQWVSAKNSSMPQGLGTGQLFTNNFNSPLMIHKGMLWHKPGISWDLTPLSDD